MRPAQVAFFVFLVLLASACPPRLDRSADDDDDAADDDDDAADDDDDDTLPPGDPGVLDSSATVTGDWSCFGPKASPGAQPGAFEGVVMDFQDDVGVPGADVEIWLDGDPSAALPFKTDATGSFAGPEGAIVSCVPFGALVSTPFEPPETYPTWHADLVVTGAPPFTVELESVSYSTYQLLPLTVGVEGLPGRALLVGRFTDCNGDRSPTARARWATWTSPQGRSPRGRAAFATSATGIPTRTNPG